MLLVEPIWCVAMELKQSDILIALQCLHFSGKSTYEWLTYICLYTEGILQQQKYITLHL